MFGCDNKCKSASLLSSLNISESDVNVQSWSVDCGLVLSRGTDRKGPEFDGSFNFI